MINYILLNNDNHSILILYILKYGLVDLKSSFLALLKTFKDLSNTAYYFLYNSKGNKEKQ